MSAVLGREQQFLGRGPQLEALYAVLAQVGADAGPEPGRVVLVSGRRRVGKSRLIEEFLDRAVVGHVYFTASTRSEPDELRRFAATVAGSNLPEAAVFAGVSPNSWDSALRLLAATAPAGEPGVVVIDDLQHLIAADPQFENLLRKLFESELSGRRILLIGIGSDPGLMEALGDSFGDALGDRAAVLTVPPLTPSEISTRLRLSPADAFDAYLLTGGLPLILQEWPPGATRSEYLAATVASPTSALLVSGERALAAEFPGQSQPREVLGAVGAGQRSFANIGRAAGHLHQGSLLRALGTLRDKRAVTADVPLSIVRSKETRYQVADPYLHFYLSFLGPYQAEIDRGRGDLTLARIEATWTSWRARAVQPVLRAALARLLPADGPVVGSYWTRSGLPEIDIVLADRAPVADRVLGVGAIKWREHEPFDDHDYGELLMHRSQLPGAGKPTPVFALSRSGSSVSGVRIFDPEELLSAW